MKQTPKKHLVEQPAEENPRMPLGRKNYTILLIGFAVILLGMVLMAGGGSDSPEEFNYAMFSFRRITLAQRHNYETNGLSNTMSDSPFCIVRE